MSSLGEFVQILVLGQEHARPQNKLRPALKNQRLNVARVWRNKYYNDFGLERMIRLVLSLAQFASIGLYVRHFAGKRSLLARKVFVELYVVLKLIIPVIIISTSFFKLWIAVVISGYMILETLIYLACFIYTSNEFAEPISYRRSLTTLFINYLQIALDYAVIYAHFNYSIPYFFKTKLHCNLQAVYFSFVTTSTVGYGDIYPVHPIAQSLVISQIILFFVFVAIFLNFFASKIQNPTYYNSEIMYRGKYPKRNRKSV